MSEACGREKERGETAKRFRQRRWWSLTPGIAMSKKRQFDKEQEDILGSGKDDWKERDMENSEEKKDRPDEIQVVENGKMVR